MQPSYSRNLKRVFSRGLDVFISEKQVQCRASRLLRASTEIYDGKPLHKYFYGKLDLLLDNGCNSHILKCFPHKALWRTFSLEKHVSLKFAATNIVFILIRNLIFFFFSILYHDVILLESIKLIQQYSSGSSIFNIVNIFNV